MHIIDALLKIIYPPRCYICRRLININAPVNICADCGAEYENIAPISGDVCAYCGRPSGGRGICADCAQKEHSLSSCYALFLYEGAVREIIYNFKYCFGPPMRPFINEIMKKHINAGDVRIKDIDYIIPVPLHKSKQHRRGFNQSAVLAGILSGITGVPVLYNALVRLKKTAPQSRLTPYARRKNIKNAFGVKLHKELIFSKAILLVDDIYTTGSTFEECAKALLTAGAGYVKGFTFCAASGKGILNYDFKGGDDL